MDSIKSEISLSENGDEIFSFSKEEILTSGKEQIVSILEKDVCKQVPTLPKHRHKIKIHFKTDVTPELDREIQVIFWSNKWFIRESANGMEQAVGETFQQVLIEYLTQWTYGTLPVTEFQQF